MAPFPPPFFLACLSSFACASLDRSARTSASSSPTTTTSKTRPEWASDQKTLLENMAIDPLAKEEETKSQELAANARSIFKRQFHQAPTS